MLATDPDTLYSYVERIFLCTKNHISPSLAIYASLALCLSVSCCCAAVNFVQIMIQKENKKKKTKILRLNLNLANLSNACRRLQPTDLQLKLAQFWALVDTLRSRRMIPAWNDASLNTQKASRNEMINLQIYVFTRRTLPSNAVAFAPHQRKRQIIY